MLKHFRANVLKELEHLRNRDEQWKEGLTKAVDELNTEREKYSNIEKLNAHSRVSFIFRLKMKETVE